MKDNLRDYENPDTARRRDFFIYEAEAAVIGVGLTVTDTIQIQADAHFILQKLTFQADIAGAALTDGARILPNVLVQITDTGSNRQLFFNPVPIVNFCGTGELPFILPNPRLFMKTSTIQIDFTSFEAVITPTVRMSFIGYKLYGY